MNGLGIGRSSSPRGTYTDGPRSAIKPVNAGPVLTPLCWKPSSAWGSVSTRHRNLWAGEARGPGASCGSASGEPGFRWVLAVGGEQSGTLYCADAPAQPRLTLIADR